MNQTEDKLSVALQAMAAASRQGPSPELGAVLKAEFHRYHVRRRRVRRVQIGLASMCMAALMALSWMAVRAKHPAAIRAVKQTSQPPLAAIGTALSEKPAPDAVKAISRNLTPKNRTTMKDDFMILPSYDPAPVGDELRIVRLEMPGTTLQLMGAPVNEEILDRRMVAEFVVGADGTAYAVRLIGNNSN